MRSNLPTGGEPGRSTTPEAGAAPGSDADFGAALAGTISELPRGLRTRFAPAPTGYLHLGHVANAVVVWGVARATRGAVILRVEDHDRQRCRSEYEAALLDDIEALDFLPSEPPISEFRSGLPSPYRQSDNDRAYATAATILWSRGLAYACDCTRSTFAACAARNGRSWTGPGCPGKCMERGLDPDSTAVTWRVALGGGTETWLDLGLGEQSGPAASAGDLAIQDRRGNWTYALCVVVDDLRHEIDLVIRGRDLVDATPAQVRLGLLLGRAAPPRFLHHRLIRQADGRKLSKADGSTSVRELLADGAAPRDLRARAASAIGLDPDM